MAYSSFTPGQSPFPEPAPLPEIPFPASPRRRLPGFKPYEGNVADLRPAEAEAGPPAGFEPYTGRVEDLKPAEEPGLWARTKTTLGALGEGVKEGATTQAKSNLAATAEWGRPLDSQDWRDRWQAEGETALRGYRKLPGAEAPTLFPGVSRGQLVEEIAPNVSQIATGLGGAAVGAMKGATRGPWGAAAGAFLGALPSLAPMYGQVKTQTARSALQAEDARRQQAGQPPLSEDEALAMQERIQPDIAKEAAWEVGTEVPGMAVQAAAPFVRLGKPLAGPAIDKALSWAGAKAFGAGAAKEGAAQLATEPLEETVSQIGERPIEQRLGISEPGAADLSFAEPGDYLSAYQEVAGPTIRGMLPQTLLGMGLGGAANVQQRLRRNLPGAALTPALSPAGGGESVTGEGAVTGGMPAAPPESPVTPRNEETAYPGVPSPPENALAPSEADLPVGVGVGPEAAPAPSPAQGPEPSPTGIMPGELDDARMEGLEYLRRKLGAEEIDDRVMDAVNSPSHREDPEFLKRFYGLDEQTPQRELGVFYDRYGSLIRPSVRLDGGQVYTELNEADSEGNPAKLGYRIRGKATPGELSELHQAVMGGQPDQKGLKIPKRLAERVEPVTAAAAAQPETAPPAAPPAPDLEVLTGELRDHLRQHPLENAARKPLVQAIQQALHQQHQTQPAGVAAAETGHTKSPQAQTTPEHTQPVGSVPDKTGRTDANAVKTRPDQTRPVKTKPQEVTHAQQEPSPGAPDGGGGAQPGLRQAGGGGAERGPGVQPGGQGQRPVEPGHAAPAAAEGKAAPAGKTVKEEAPYEQGENAAEEKAAAAAEEVKRPSPQPQGEQSPSPSGRGLGEGAEGPAGEGARPWEKPAAARKPFTPAERFKEKPAEAEAPKLLRRLPQAWEKPEAKIPPKRALPGAEQKPPEAGPPPTPAETKPAQPETERTAGEFEEGDRVVLSGHHNAAVKGRHGVVVKKQVVTWRTAVIAITHQGILPTHEREPERTVYYDIKTDNGTTVPATQKDLSAETGAAPTDTVPDIQMDGEWRLPGQVWSGAKYDLQTAKNNRETAARARKPDKKAALLEAAKKREAGAKLSREAFEAWAVQHPEAAQEASQGEWKPAGERPSPQPSPAGEGARKESALLDGPLESKNPKTGKPLYVVSIKTRVERPEYERLLGIAQQHHGYYFSGRRVRGAIPGFTFNDRADAAAFMNAVEPGTAEAVAERPAEAKPAAATDLAAERAAIVGRVNAALDGDQRLAEITRGILREPSNRSIYDEDIFPKAFIDAVVTDLSERIKTLPEGVGAVYDDLVSSMKDPARRDEAIQAYMARLEPEPASTRPEQAPEAKTEPTQNIPVKTEPDKTIPVQQVGTAKAPAAESAEIAQARKDLEEALADLGQLALDSGFFTKSAVPAFNSGKLLPVLSRVMDAAFRLGYYQFKAAAKFALDTIRDKFGDAVADGLTLDHLQGAYIAMAGDHPGQGADTKAAVIAVENLAEIHEYEYPRPESDTGEPEIPGGVPPVGEGGVGTPPGNGPGQGRADPTADAGVLATGAAEDVGEAAASGGRGGSGADTGVQGGGRLPAEPPGGHVLHGRPGAGGAGLVSHGPGGRGTRGRPEQRTGPLVSPEDRAEVDGGEQTRPSNYFMADPERIVGGGPKARFARNRRAIETFNALDGDNRPPTPEEMDDLAAYIGWGAFGQELFNGSWERPRPKEGWAEEDRWLREHLGEDRWKSAQASIINAHYTDPPTVSAIWSMLGRMGFKGGRVLEPSMGIGNFFGLMPREVMARSDLTGIEMDRLSGGMAQMLYPDANIQIKPYQDSKTADDFYDLVVGNWPFHRDGPADRRYSKLNPSLHNYFFLKALDQVRPGGLVVGITSAGTLDSLGKAHRLELARKAELVAAFRLPSGAFQQYAGTKVVTDILILKKRETPTTDVSGAGWIESVKTDTPAGQPINVNEYWQAHPDQVLGTLTWGHGTTSGRPGMIVDRPADFPERLAALPEKVPEAIYSPRTTKDTIRYITNNTTDRQNSIVTHADGKLYVVRGERLAPLQDVAAYQLKDPKQTAKREQQIAALVGLRRAYGLVIDAERRSAADTETLRTDLNGQYQAFVKAFGRINDSVGIGYFKKVSDPYYAALASLERNTGTEEKPVWAPTAILSRPTTRGKKQISEPNVADAFVLARNEALDLDMARVAELAKITEEAAIQELLSSGAVYRTPAGTYEPSDQYLAGNVRRKLREAFAAQEQGLDMARNIEALRKALPTDVPYFAIEAKLGAPWVAAEQYGDFVAELLSLNADQRRDVTVRYMPSGWKVDFARDYVGNKPEARALWGVSFYPFHQLVEAAMSNRSITIRRWDDIEKKYVVREDLTEEVNNKAMRLREEFQTWAWKDVDRRMELEREYNEVMNAIATAKYDGAFLHLEGMALERGDGPFNLREHQINAIWRGLINGRGIYAHEVGTGKTFTIAGIAVESRRYGLAKKPLVIAHNANSASVAREINEMYPAAKVLYVNNLAPEQIETTLRQIANDDWDAVVLPHSLLDRLSLKADTLRDLAADDIAQLEQEALEAAQADNANLTVAIMNDPEEMKKVRSPTAKELVAARNRIIKKIEEAAIRASRENALFFEDLGIDMVIVDESHAFKKPPLATQMKMKGLNKGVSNRSLGLRFMTDYVRRNNHGKGVHLFTGTLITNTLNEVYNQMRYVMDDQMTKDGVRDWDAWFNTFADALSDVELTDTGEYDAVTRLSGFVNVPELRRMVGQYLDIVFADEMPEFVPRATPDGKKLTDPDLSEADREFLLNGRTENPVGRPYKKVVTDTAEMSPAQRSIMTELVRRANVWKNATPKARYEMTRQGAPETPAQVGNAAANAGLDARLFDLEAPDHEQSKVNRVVRNVMTHYREHPQATQAVFMEIGYSDYATRTRTGAGGVRTSTRVPRFNLAKDLVAKLVAAGIPKAQIAVVDGSVSKEKRKEIADKMNTGQIRVVLGSTLTLGTGVNMQNNLRAMHHLDAPWMPGDLEQRNGRGHRQGNQWNTVLEYRYITERLDGRRWQVLVIKQKFIDAFMKADDKTRIIEGDAVSLDEDVDAGSLEQTLSAAAGDPRILMRAKLTADVAKLENRERLHSQGVVDARQRAGQVEQQIRAGEQEQEKLGTDIAAYEAQKGEPFAITIRKQSFDDKKTQEDDINAALLEAADTLPVQGAGERMSFRRIGSYKGFAIEGGRQNSLWGGLPKTVLRLNGATEHEINPSLGSIEATLRAMPRKLDTLKQRMDEARVSVAKLREAAKLPFGQQEALNKKRKLLADIEADLQVNPEPAPAWLRNGAPVGADVYRQNHTDTPLTVQGHRWASDGYFVVVETAKGIQSLPYSEVVDANNLPVYEAREFTAPTIQRAPAARRPAAAGNTPTGIGPGHAVTVKGFEGVWTVQRVMGPADGSDDPSLWQAEVEIEGGGHTEIVALLDLTEAAPMEEAAASEWGRGGGSFSVTAGRKPHTWAPAFRRGDRGAGMSVAAVREALAAGMGPGLAKLEAAGTLQIVRTVAGAPAGMRGRLRGDESGFYWDGRAWLIAENLSEGQVVPTLLHELGEHYGLKAMLGAKAYTTLQARIHGLHQAGNVRVTAAWDAVLREYRDDQGRLLFKEGSEAHIREVLARLGETGGLHESWWQALLAKLKVFLLRHGLMTSATLKRLSDADLHGLLVASVRRAEREAGRGERGWPSPLPSPAGRGREGDAVWALARQLGVDPGQLRKEFEAVVLRHFGSMAAYEAVKAEAGQNGLKAPDGSDTKLNKQQWVLVRTPRFKAWFGDWQQAAAIHQLTEGRPIEVQGDEFAEFIEPLNMPALRDKARSYGAAHVVGAYRNAPSGLELEVRPHGIEEAIQHGSGPDKLKVFAAIPELLRTGQVVYDGMNPKNPKGRLVVISRLVAVGGKRYAVSAGLREDPNGRLFYDHELLEVSRVGGLSSQPGEGPKPRHPAPTPTRLTEYYRHFIGEKVHASQVVDANGEPLVVFHGTNREFYAFETAAGPRSKAVGDWAGVHFTNDRGQAHSIAEALARTEGGQARVVDAFLRAVNPAQFGRFRSAEQASAAGHDARLTENNTGLQEWTVFQPTQIKSATGNTGAFDPNNPDIRYQRPAGVFYSELAQQLGNVKASKAPGVQWKAIINGLKQKGVKQDEIDWSGVMEWLDLATGPVTKEQVQGFVEGNGVRVEEVMTGDTDAPFKVAAARLENAGYTVYDGEGTYYVIDKTNNEVEREALPDDLKGDFDTVIAAIPYGDEPPAGERYAQWQLPGGKNYQELLITLPLPPPPPAEKPEGAPLTQDEKDQLQYLAMILLDRDHKPAEKAEYEDLSSRNKKAQPKPPKTQPIFKTQHWDEPNILAHIRFNDRTDADGKRVLFLEEIQSDWGQEGKRRGFAKPEYTYKPSEWTGPSKQRVGEETFYVYRHVSGEELEVSDADIPTAGELLKTPELLKTLALENFQDREANGGRGAPQPIPRAPFVTDTKAWVGLALKRAIRYAAENGFDRVAWTTGEQQAERYDLSKHISELAYWKDGEDTWGVSLLDRDARPIAGWNPNDFLDAAALENHLGKELARKIIEDEGEYEPDDSEWINPKTGKLEEGVAVIQDEGLKVGGEGMKGFYDAIVPQVANSLLKKFGGGKVGVVAMASTVEYRIKESGDKFTVQSRQDATSDWAPMGQHATRKAAEDAIVAFKNSDHPLWSTAPYKQPGFDLTPALKDRALMGLPLFRREDSALTPSLSRGERGEDARLARARAQGYDTSQRWYHGTPIENDIRAFDLGKVNPAEPVIFLTDNPEVAAAYGYQNETVLEGEGFREDESGGSILPVFIRGRLYDASGEVDGRYDRTVFREVMEKARAQGYDGVDFGRLVDVPGGTPYGYPAGRQIAMFQPNHIRSIHAEFDPARKGLDDLLFSRPDTAPEAALQAVEEPARARAARRPDKAKAMQWWDKLKRDGRRQRLGLLKRDQLAEVAEPVLPDILARYLPIAKAIDADRNETHEKLGKITQAWSAAASEDKAGADAMANLMHDETLAGVDGSKPYRPIIDIEEAKKTLGALRQSRDAQVASKQRQARLAPGEAARYVREANEITANLNAQMAEVRRKMAQEMRRRGQYEPLRKRWNALPKVFQRIHNQVRDYHEWAADQTLAALIARIQASAAGPVQKRALIEELRLEFESARVTAPYFPLGRVGDYWVYAKDKAGNPSFDMFETREEQAAFIAELKEEGAEVLGRGKRGERTGELPEVSAGFVARVESRVAELGNLPEVRDLRDDIWQLYLQTLPELSARRHAIHRQKRAGFSADALQSTARKGFHDAYMLARLRHSHRLEATLEDLEAMVSLAESDAQRAALRRRLEWFEEYQGLRGYTDLAALQAAKAATAATAAAAEAALEQARKALAQWESRAARHMEGPSPRPSPAGEGERLTKLREAVKERGKTAREAGRAAEKAAQFHTWFRQGFNPGPAIAQALHRLEGAERVGGADNGIDKARDYLGELGQFHQEMLNPSGSWLASVANSVGFAWFIGASISSALVNGLQTPVVAMPFAAARYGAGPTARAFKQAFGEFFSTRNMTIEAALVKQARGFAPGSAGRRRAMADLKGMRVLRRAGVFDKTLSLDLAGLAEEGVDYSGTRARWMGWMSFAFHHTERMNREITARAVYLLAHRAQTAKGAADGEARGVALREAERMTHEAHLDYTAANRARFMRGTGRRIITQFKQYSQGITYLLLRAAHQAFKGATPEQKAEARKRLGGLLAMQFLFAGAKGLPIGLGIWAAQGLAGALGDDDEPWDWEAEARRALLAMGEGMGLSKEQAQTFERFAWKGGVDAFTPWAISDRVGMSELWVRDPDKELEGKDLSLYLYKTLGGPMTGIAENWVNGARLIADGNYERGIEKFMPAWASHILKAGRFAAEDAKTLKGLPLVKDLTPAELAGQAIGLMPARLAAQYETNQARMNRDQALTDRRRELLQGWAAAIQAKDADARKEAQAAALRFNRLNPAYAVYLPQVLQSVRQQGRIERSAVGGLPMSRRMKRDLAEREGEF